MVSHQREDNYIGFKSNNYSSQNYDSPRPGNFVYSQKEISQMESDISFCKKQGVKK